MAASDPGTGIGKRGSVGSRQSAYWLLHTANWLLLRGRRWSVYRQRTMKLPANRLAATPKRATIRRTPGLTQCIDLPMAA